MGQTSVAYRRQRLERLLALLRECAAAGRPCPTNVEIAQALDLPSPDQTRKYLYLLRDRGLIRIEQGARFRIIEVVETGQRTAAPVTKPRPYQQGQSPEDITRRAAAVGAQRAAIAARIVPDRSPCTRCGARGDTICKHREGTPMLITEIRDQERCYRARLALRLGLNQDDIRMVFDLSEEQLARLAKEAGIMVHRQLGSRA